MTSNTKVLTRTEEEKEEGEHVSQSSPGQHRGNPAKAPQEETAGVYQQGATGGPKRRLGDKVQTDPRQASHGKI